jgi:outer membrane protein assembly factor BamB
VGGPVATPRVINDIERLVDLVGSVSRVGDNVCVQAFQSSIGCVNATRGNLLWTRPANGVQGINGDDRLLFGTEADGTVLAWKRSDGERVWSAPALPAGLTAPFLAGRSVVIGDATPASSTCCRVRTALFSTALAPMTVSASRLTAGNAAVAVTRNPVAFGFSQITAHHARN